MDDSYFESSPVYMGRGLKLLVLLTVLRVQNPVLWAAFFSSNPRIRKWLRKLNCARKKDPVTVERRIHKLANIISAAFLYMATYNNNRVPKDYILLFLGETYYGKLVPPRSPIVVSPTTAQYFRLGSYKESGFVNNLYRNKHYVVLPFIYGQLLSNYLTPTRYKLNQRYFSPLVKTRFLDPIWKNFRLGVRAHSIDWPGICGSYTKHNGVLFLYMIVLDFRTRFWKKYLELNGEEKGLFTTILIQFVIYCGHRANTVANFIYTPNILSMFLLSATAPMLTLFPPLKNRYLVNQKHTIKIYMRTIGFTSGLLAIVLQKMKSSRKSEVESNENTQNLTESQNLGPDFYNAISLYFSQLIVLSKWRTLKENHPWFTVLKVGTWQRMETGVMCYLVWKLMNLNDYILRNTHVSGNQELDTLRRSPWIRAINRIMN